MNVPEELNQKTIFEMLKHAKEGYPEEVCGVVVDTKDGEKYVRCSNVAVNPTQDFKMSPESLIAAEELGDIIGIVHSHPDATTQPSTYDIAVMSTNRDIELMLDPQSVAIPWHIVSWPDGDYRQIIPKARTELTGRPFVHGVWDCWQVCNDYYRKYHGIKFEQFDREDCWWEKKDGDSLYEKWYPQAGFERVDTPQIGDMIVMQIGRTYHPNHAAIYLGNIDEFEGESLHGGPFILHHMYAKKSNIAVYGGQWEQRTRLILRHKEI